ncbi:hypothetical protein DCC62_04815 [candidate division KSB1 bacterium]|nr:MAG: hypothetical protein DCC62_04815 [candidate division KSB1 bacterium]
MKKTYSIITPKTYSTSGAQKTIWLKAGTMRVINSGEIYLEWNANPNVTYKVVEQKSREENMDDAGQNARAP